MKIPIHFGEWVEKEIMGSIIYLTTSYLTTLCLQFNGIANRFNFFGIFSSFPKWLLLCFMSDEKKTQQRVISYK